MALTLLLMKKIIAMLIWAITGFILVRAGILKTEESKTISTLLIYALMPCMIVRAFIIDLTADKMKSFLFGIAFAFAVMCIWILFTSLIRKPLKLTPIDQATLCYTNCGNLIIPLVSMIFGEEYVFYVAAFQVVFNLFVWTHAVILLRGTDAVNLKKILFTPNLIAITIGILLMLSGIQIPDIIDTAASGFSSMVGPGSMLVVGMTIGSSDLGAVFRFKKAYLITIARLILYPLLIMVLLYVSGIFKIYPAFISDVQISILCVLAPSATLIAQFGVLYDKEPYNASAYNIMTTICCIVTIPLMFRLFQLMFPTV